MERLTQKENDKLIMVKQDYGEYIPAYWDEDNFRAIEKLADYEELEEQGLLVRLPCKVGDMVYKLWYYDGKPYKIQRHVIKTLSELCGTMESKKFGKSVFLTSEEAEKKLEELENGK
nr:MAG TPA: hypothetical protein [Caudoviricetes sp.]